MFSLDTVHLKAYVLIKMLRKELFVPQYRDRLSTFHFKTALLYAVENTLPDMWREENLINCVKYILGTLRRFLTRHNCPHFTIENVNLFDGKIERHEFPKLVDQLKFVIFSLRSMIEHIQMDIIGQTLKDRSTRKTERNIYSANESALFKYVCYVFQADTDTFQGFGFLKTLNNDRKALFRNAFTHFKTFYRAPLGKYKEYDYVLHNTMTSLASFVASAYLEQKVDGHSNDPDDINEVRSMYAHTLEFGILGNYMRYASFLFCNGEYYEACKYFDLIEKQIEEDKQHNLINRFLVFPSDELSLQIAKQSCEKSSKQRRNVFLKFKKADSMCVPELLRCEMYSFLVGNHSSSNIMLPFHGNYRDCMCVHIDPFLSYLQYLTYRLLKQNQKRSEALVKLLLFTDIVKPEKIITLNTEIFFISHFDSSLKMLWHCQELEHKLESVWKT
ncbi:hypothetical protein DPMN_132294 [Dreissena polymorpha]|uniref:Mab-21-like HhH/H2TH-like domain-containing protein n=1 Tax=Dreissena polymorpha TaxID=45954 RepID=A0A9D4J9Y9_DREPO|nr:hypothetical protein DPMN_132294 [Dreissena polymorpha]